MALLLNLAVIVFVCAASCAVARWVGQRVDNADKKPSQRQWQLMCEALGLEDLPAADFDTSPAPSPASLVREATLTAAVR